MILRTYWVALCAGLITAHTAFAVPLSEKQKAELLAAQNKYRAELGEPSLVWSDKLAEAAQSWAEHLANEVHAIKHSGAMATGENIATWPAGHATLTRLVKIWGDEKQYFVDAVFPDVSRTGDWLVVSHYSQLVWRKTTDVGCGFATGGGQDYLVCQYNPMGNFNGEKAF
ncbi:MAG TPA: CAP domain-containing protein [Rhizomicrobium sp.]|nr:CAP domain-containing protein [Rhizomicrobium sp.]